jgi:arylsulfatase A-like enzyme
MMDQLTLDAALEGLQTLDLGRGPQSDVLAISLSATDYVGHRYGPDSREQHDNILRLDRALGAFIDSLFKLRDSTTIVFALTADHAVTSFPELIAQRAHRAPPPRYDVSKPFAALRATLERSGVDTSAVEFDGALVLVNREAFDLAHVDPEPILARFADALSRQPGIARVDRVRDLARRDTANDAVSRRWLHMLPPDLPVALVVTPVRGAYPVGASIAEHGTPYDDDAHVPLIFFGPGIRTGRYPERALVADAAPTLARILGVTPIERVDGHVLERAFTGSTPY